MSLMNASVSTAQTVTAQDLNLTGQPSVNSWEKWKLLFLWYFLSREGTRQCPPQYDVVPFF